MSRFDRLLIFVNTGKELEQLGEKVVRSCKDEAKMPKTYTVKQIADALGFSTNTVYKYLEEGKIKATRLGKEGRFRISAQELARLMGPTIIAASVPVPEQLNEVVEKGGLRTPDLFCWFLSLIGIFVGLGVFLFPLEYRFLSYQSWKGWTLGAGIMAVLGGSGMMVSDTFGRRKIWHTMASVILAVGLGILTNVFRLAGNWTSAAWFLMLTLTAATSAFWGNGGRQRFMGLVYGIGILTGLIAIWAPVENSVMLAWLFAGTDISPVVLTGLWVGGLTVAAGLWWLGERKYPILYYGIGGGAGLVYFVTAVLYVDGAYWTRGVVAMLVAAFAFLFLFVKRLDWTGSYARKQIVEIFGWMVTVLVVGVVAVYCTQTLFKNFILEKGQERVRSVVEITENYVEDGSRAIESFAGWVETLRLTEAYEGGQRGKILTELDELSRNMFKTTGLFRRVGIIGREGEVLSLYPGVNGETRTKEGLGDRAYFLEAKKRGGLVVSKVMEPKLSVGSPAVVYIAAPIKDERGEFRGIVAGAIDAMDLIHRLSSVEVGERGYVVVADGEGTMLLHPDGTKVGRKVVVNKSLVAAIAGKTGIQEGYGESGELMMQAYAPIKDLGWGVVVNQPYTATFRRSTMLSFGIFLMTILAGMGTLFLLAGYRSKRS